MGTLSSANWPEPQDPPSAEDWKNFRTVFYQLYVILNMRLQEVKQIMEEQYGFKAT